MPLYIHQAAYTPESLAAQIREPADWFEAVRPAFEAMGGKIVAAVTRSASTTCSQ